MKTCLMVLAAALLPTTAMATVVSYGFEAQIATTSQIGTPGGLVTGTFSYDDAILPTTTFPSGTAGAQSFYDDPSVLIDFSFDGKTYGNQTTFVVDNDGNNGDTLYVAGLVGPFILGLGLNDPTGTLFASAAPPAGIPALLPGSAAPYTGTFGLSDPGRCQSLNATIVSFVQQGSSVPEPGAWMLMLAGFGLTGASIRRERMRGGMATAYASSATDLTPVSS